MDNTERGIAITTVASEPTEPIRPSVGAAKTRNNSRSKPKRFFSFIWKAALFCLLFPVLQVSILRFIDAPVSTMMIYQSIARGFSGESMAFHHTNISWNEMPDSFIKAVIAGEDQKFFQHNGFDWTEIEKAQAEHKRHPKRPMRGASTISQQTAKNLFLPPWHSFIRKGVEAYYTFLIELLWSKQRILEQYANIVELAPRIYGIEAGAAFHFHKEASALSAVECARLAAVLPNPERWSASKPTPYIQRRSSRILMQMRGFLPIDEDDGDPD